jgi:Uma2 family endonuclease
MSTVDQLVAPLIRSPQLPQAVELLRNRLEAEMVSRRNFYQEVDPSQKAEFIDGEVVLHSPAKSYHLKVTLWTAQLLNTYVTLHQLGSVYSEKCLCVFPRNDYEPDVVFFKSEKASALKPSTMKFPIPDFVAEVLSETTEHRDRGIKFEDFEANGVEEYWIVDPEALVVEQYLLINNRLTLHCKSNNGMLTSAAMAGLSIPVQGLFQESVNLATLRVMLG